ncbi:MAG TPA: cyclic nucleotide-binding domain-containing protein [Kouleothrix sp.]|uniref:cyclic nucleotide-binding domain-containing protein n=1 Tax=Kouleothrix sp. TaxID=2779161 RepID=UPI002C87459D|nr:cyclic nucleotide-binding domain-containing protein [Kouleothrix sp.]HRC77833.1 cyclic nucleotide-binding domain-containing protein [Kouleothrix sp.]
MMGASLEHQRQHDLTQAHAQALARQHEQRSLRQVAALAQLDCLRGVAPEHLAQIAAMSALRAFVPGTVILHERAPCEFVYLILRGTVSLALHDRGGQKVLIGILNRGDCFGEGPLFGDLFRGASVTAETICYLLQIPRSQLRTLLPEAPELAQALRSIYRHRLVESTLGQVPLFSRLSPFERSRLAALLQPEHYPRGATIIREGEPGQALYVIEEGQVVVAQGEQTIAHLDEGNFFGEMALLDKLPHNADVRALTPVEVLALPAADFAELLRQQPALLVQLKDVANQRRADNAAIRTNHERTQELNAAIQRGLLRGTHVLVRDPARCVEGCRLCEEACAARFGATRITFNGVMLHNLDVTNSCRQCRVGAECVEACPENAIQWNDNGALVVTDQCTGCGACVPACPYDAVQLVADKGAHSSPLWALWRQIKHLRHPTIPLQASQPPQRANKCDLCHGHSDMACVSACPTGALRLMPVEELFSF